MIVVPVLRNVSVESLGPTVAPVIWRSVVTGVSATAAGDPAGEGEGEAAGEGEGEAAGEAAGEGDGATAGDTATAGAGDSAPGFGVGAGTVVGATGLAVHPTATRLAAIRSSGETLCIPDPEAEAMPPWSPGPQAVVLFTAPAPEAVQNLALGHANAAEGTENPTAGRGTSMS